jgi:hypothetical protein
MILTTTASLNVDRSTVRVGPDVFEIPDDWRLSQVATLLANLGWTVGTHWTDNYPVLTVEVHRDVVSAGQQRARARVAEGVRKNLVSSVDSR